MCLGRIKECNVRLIYNIQFFFPDCHYISYLTSYNSLHLHTNSINFSSTSEDKQAALIASKHSKCSGGDVRLHIIGIEQVQTGLDPFCHVKHSLSAVATEWNWDVTETFLSVWTSPFNYTSENFTEQWRSATERKCDIQCESALILPCRRFLDKKLHEDRNLSFSTHSLYMTQIPVTSINNSGYFTKRSKELFPHNYGPTTGSFTKIHMSVRDHSAHTRHKIPWHRWRIKVTLCKGQRSSSHILQSH